MKVNRRYLVAVASLAVLAVVFGVFGTVAPPLAEESGPTPQQESSSESVGHFQNPPTYDSGWVNITTKAGQYFTLKHGLNTTEVFVDITGKQSLDPMGGTLAWNRTYGGTATADYAYSLVQTGDGGYALAGYFDFYGVAPLDSLLVKTNSAGTMQWSRTYGGTGLDYANSVVQASDGGYALAGWTTSYGAGVADFWLVKTDSAGTMQWNRTYGGTNNEYAYSVVQTGDGGYAFAGYTVSYGAGAADFWLIKTDSAGVMQWNKTYGGTSADWAYSLVQTSDGGYALAGYTNSGFPNYADFWLVKTDAAGTMQWNRTYGGTKADYAYSLVQTFDGGYALAGETKSYGVGTPSNANFWLVKTNSAGTMQWSRTYGGTNPDYARSVIQTGDGGYALVGYTGWTSSYDDWLVKTDSAGTMQWNRTYGGAVDEPAYSVVQTGDGGYALAGYTWVYGIGYDFWLVRVNAEMNLEHQRNLNTETGLTMTSLTNNTIVLYRSPTDPYWNYVRVRIWLIKEPTWIYGDINMDGVVDVKDLYIVSRNYGKTFSLLSLSGIISIAGIRIIKKRKQNT